MSYQALARRWRPKLFSEVVGQEHVVGALANALDHDRVHHAFLFSGTRGVGKTTIARLLAKALNCQHGVTSTPCGTCSACVAVDEGRFVDLIEVDAASRTKVEQTRELLENVQYTPTQGRYKIYLVDEVHMLSAHSFNALLKTLEEPPPHVKFLLATTDPQKLPATVVSRCLQFHLRLLDSDEIAAQFRTILDAEGTAYEDQALAEIARSAAGSLRDGLSLLDQALAFGGGRLELSKVRELLGTIDIARLGELLDALARGDGAALLDTVAELGRRTVDYAAVLDAILSVLHRISVRQTVPGIRTAADPDEAMAAEFADRISPEDVQLYYQIGLLGKRDMNLAPDQQTGFEMTLVRMLTFRPDDGSGQAGASGPSARRGSGRRADRTEAAGVRAAERDRTVRDAGAAGAATPKRGSGGASVDPASVCTDADEWTDLVASLPVRGVVRELAMNIAPAAWDSNTLRATLGPAHRHLLNPRRQKALEEALTAGVGVSVRLQIDVGERAAPSASQVRAKRNEAAVGAAQVALENDPNVQEMMRLFDARIVPESIEPATGKGNRR